VLGVGYQTPHGALTFADWHARQGCSGDVRGGGARDPVRDRGYARLVVLYQGVGPGIGLNEQIAQVVFLAGGDDVSGGGDIFRPGVYSHVDGVESRAVVEGLDDGLVLATTDGPY
jgi:hypothetical protein